MESLLGPPKTPVINRSPAPSSTPDLYHTIFTFRMSRRRREMYTWSRPSVCLSVTRRIPTLYCTEYGPGCNLGEWLGCPLVGHCWTDLQSVHGFRCYDNRAPNAKCQRVHVFALCLVIHIGPVRLSKLTVVSTYQSLYRNSCPTCPVEFLSN